MKRFYARRMIPLSHQYSIFERQSSWAIALAYNRTTAQHIVDLLNAASESHPIPKRTAGGGKSHGWAGSTTARSPKPSRKAGLGQTARLRTRAAPYSPCGRGGWARKN